MAFTIAHRSFAAGEISPDLYGRTDQVKYQTGLATCRNWVTRLEGSADNRTGSGYIGPLRNFANAVPRQIPFIFNDDQAYSLVLHIVSGACYVLIIKNGDYIKESAKTITGITKAFPPVATSIAHGYDDGDLIYLRVSEGMPEVSNRWFKVYSSTADTYELNEESTFNGSGFTTFVSGTSERAVCLTDLPYTTEAQLSELRYKQSGDVIFLTHPNFPVYTVTRLADTSWFVIPAVFEPNIDAPIDGALTGTAGAITTKYRVTAVDADTLEESFAGLETAKTTSINTTVSPMVVTKVAHGYDTADEIVIDYNPALPASVGGLTGTKWTITKLTADTYSLDGSTALGAGTVTSQLSSRTYIKTKVLAVPAAGTPITVAWTAVSGALEYNIYREINGIFGYIGTSSATSFIDRGYDVDAFDTPPVDFDVFAATGDYPTCVGFYQQSLILGGPDNDPERIRKSRTGLFYNFTKSNPIQADDAISWIMASGQVNAVRHFLDMGRLLVFTQGAVHSMEGDDAGTLTPTAINPRLRAEQGVGDIQPLPVGDVALFVQSSGKIVRELIPDAGDRYQSNDLTVFSKHLFKLYPLTRWTYAEEPISLVWCVRSDGALLGLTYLRKHEILGWHKHDTGDGDEFVDVCAIPEDNESILYAAVRRYDVNGHDRVYMERFASRQSVAEPMDGRFLDSFLVYDGTNTDGSADYELHYDTTHETPADYWLDADGTTENFVAGDVGNAVVLTMEDGTTVRCIIAEIYNATEARVTLEGSDNLDGVTLPFSTDEWAWAVDGIGGLWHLEGRTVYAMSEGQAAGPFTVEDGEITLPATSYHVVVGLRIIADLKTLEPDNAQGETWADKPKEMGEVTVRVVDTLGISVGLSEDSLQEFSDQWTEEPSAFDDAALYSGRLRVLNKTTSTPTGQILIRQSAPLPATVTGVYAVLDTGER